MKLMDEEELAPVEEVEPEPTPELEPEQEPTVTAVQSEFYACGDAPAGSCRWRRHLPLQEVPGKESPEGA